MGEGAEDPEDGGGRGEGDRCDGPQEAKTRFESFETETRGSGSCGFFCYCYFFIPDHVTFGSLDLDANAEQIWEFEKLAGTFCFLS